MIVEWHFSPVKPVRPLEGAGPGKEKTMPLTRITLTEGKPRSYLKAVSDSLHQALVEAYDVPPTDRFQIIQQARPGELVFDRTYFGGAEGPRSDDFIIFAITAGRPRSTKMKAAFCRRLTELLAAAVGIRPADVMVVISTSQMDEWSFSDGRLQMVEAAEAAAV